MPATMTMEGIMRGITGTLAEEATALVEWLKRSVVRIETPGGQGAGVVWRPDGLIVTNHHVAPGGPVVVDLADERRMKGQVIAVDRDDDLAAVKVPAEDLPAAAIGDSRALRVGQAVVAVGHPFGVRDTATWGIISGIGPGTWMGRSRRELVHADVELAPGNSGGPLAGVDGRVIGVASMVVSPGIAMAVPSHVVQQFVDGVLAALRRAGRPW